MSKGGGAKVYFVLYLAVVLELLIIIVERDEAEEHLHAKQKEAMKIVQSILSQLQTGSGTEGINTRPQDEISFAPDGISEADLGVKIKSSRKYIVEVGVTNVASELKQREGEEPKEFRERIEKMTELANVTELEYSVFECKDNDPNNCPIFPTDDEIVDKGGINKLSIGSDLTKDGKNWKLLTKAKLEIDEEATAHNVTSNMANISKSTLEPTYKAAKFEGSEFRPTADMLPGEQTFYYSTDETKKSADAKGSRGIDKRSFVVNFQPSKGGPGQTSWYKLYFTSKTNKILGVKKLKGDNEVNLDDSESKVNIGTVQLKTKDLKKVMSEIERDVQASLPPEVLYEEFKKKQDVQLFDKALQNAESEAKKTDAEKANKIKLYGYIVKLLVPGLSASFEQNKGSIQFNVRVVMPKSQKKESEASIPTDFYCFDELAPSVKYSISPYLKNGSNVKVEIFSKPNNFDKDDIKQLPNLTSPISTVTHNNGQPLPGFTENAAASFVGIADKTLSPGEYVVRVTNTANGSTRMAASYLTVFPTRNKKSNDDLAGKLKVTVMYGSDLNFAYEPTSGKKISGDQFEVRLSKFNNNKSESIVPSKSGYFLAKGINDVDYYFDNKFSKYGVEIVWKDPNNGRICTIFPYLEGDISQSPPKISTGYKMEIAGIRKNTAEIEVTGLRVQIPALGSPKGSKQMPAKGDIKIEIKAKSEGLEITDDVSYSLSDISPDGFADLNLTFSVAGKPDKYKQVSGEVTLDILSSIINKFTQNKKVSGVAKAPITIQVTYKAK